MKTFIDRKKLIYNIIVLTILAATIGATVYLKRSRETSNETGEPRNNVPVKNKESELVDDTISPGKKDKNDTADSSDKIPDSPKESLPRLVDLGADKCIPCKMMAPILENLKEEYKDQFEVEFIDVWKNPDAGKQYRIKLIPTQIFFDSKGKEVFRHEGFFSKEDILAKWKELKIAIKEVNHEDEK